MNLPSHSFGLFSLCFTFPFILCAADKNEAPIVELPTLSIQSAPVPGENKIVGSYGQPEWSARRPFPGVSVYVVPEGEYEVELGSNTQSYGSESFLHREWTQELEIGLRHRLQLTFENSLRNFHELDTIGSRLHEDSLTTSLRYALRNWGKMPLNPAFSVGWRMNSGQPGALQLGAVIGDELSPRWHWAANVTAERQLGGLKSREVSGDGAISYSLTNETLNVGLQAGWRSLHGAEEAAPSYAHAGPCLQYRPWDEFHINAVWLLSHRSHGAPSNEIQISVGFEFGEGADDHDDEPRRGGKFDR